MIRKDEFVKRFAAKGYTKKASGVIYDDFISVIFDALGEGEGVSMRGFGTFDIREHAAREVVAPSTGKRVKIPPYNVVRFIPGKALKKLVKTGIVTKE